VKRFTHLVFAVLMMLGVSTQAGATYTDYVSTVYIPYWVDDRACIKVGTEWFRIDLHSQAGRAIYAMALVAHSSNQQVVVDSWNDKPLEGGCGQGNTMNPLKSLTFEEG